MRELRSRLRLVVIPAIISLFSTLVILTFPTYPYLITDALSEKAVLSYAHEHGWHFGTDIVFSYGPAGFLASRYFFAHAASVRFWVDICFSVGVCAGVTRLAWMLRPVWRWLLIGTFIFLSANIDPRYDLLLYLAVFAWGALCFFETGGQLLLDIACLSVLLAFGMLVKANFLFLAAVVVPALAADLMLRDNPKPAVVLVAGFAACFLLGWFAAGQSWRNLGPFFRNIPALASGYNGAVGLDGLRVLRSRGLIAVSLLALAALSRAFAAYRGVAKGNEIVTTNLPTEKTIPEADSRAESPAQPAALPSRSLRVRQLVLALWFAGWLLLIWKHGFVRADLFHMGFFFGFSPFCALALEAWACGSSPAFRISRILAIACWLVVIFTLQRWCFPPLPSSLIQPFRCLSANAAILFRPITFKTESLRTQREEFSKLDLPEIRQTVGTAAVDVFGQGQLYALHNDLNYHPRPVFQSYMGYNLRLSRLNEKFYASRAAPEYVLFQLDPIDHKFPPLEDSLVLRDLLFNYEPVLTEKPYLLLKRASIVEPRVTLLKQAIIQIGEPVDLKPFGQTNLWIEINIDPSFRGQVREFFYKPPVIRLVVWSGKSKVPYKAPAPMLATGFVASPLLLNEQDVRGFCSGIALREPGSESLKRPEAYSIQTDEGGQVCWRQQVQWRIYALEGGYPHSSQAARVK